MSSLRIAVYHNLHSGGAKRVTTEHLNRLSEHHTVTLFSTSMANHAFANSDSNATSKARIYDFQRSPWIPSPFGRLNPLMELWDIRRLNDLSRTIANQIDGEHFDVVLVHPCQITQTPLVLGWLKTPSVYYCHELPRRLYEPPVPRPYKTRSWLRRKIDTIDFLQSAKEGQIKRMDLWAACKSTRILTNSMYNAKQIAATYTQPIEVVYPAVEASNFHTTHETREKFVLSVGSLTPSKGFDTVIMGIGAVPKSKRPPLTIISNFQEPKELEYLTNLAREKDVTVTFRVDISEAELKSFYARAAFVVYTPVREPLGLVALETMASGIAIIGVDEGGVAETIVDKKTGILSPRDPKALGAAIETLIDNPDYARQLGDAGRQYVMKQWNWDLHMQKLEAFLYQTAGKDPLVV